MIFVDRAGHTNEALSYLDKQKHYASVGLRVAGRLASARP